MRLFALLLVSAAFLAGAEENNKLSGRRAPGFSLPDADFNRYDLQDYRGSKWVLIEFVNSGCPLCRELSKTLEAAKAKYGSKLEILAVFVPPDTTATVARYSKELGLTYPLLFDQGQMAASYFNLTPQNPKFHTPHVFIIDPRGTIVRDFGHSEENHEWFEEPGLFRMLEELFSGKAGPVDLKRETASGSGTAVCAPAA